MAAHLRFIHRFEAAGRDRIFRYRVNPLDEYDDLDFYNRFRFRRHDLLQIFDEFEPRLRHLATRKGSLPPQMQIMIALRFFASGSYQIVVADLFGVSKATAHRCIKRVSDIIAANLDRHVFFNAQNVPATKRKFYVMAGVPEVIGCLDCTHIRIQRPVENKYEFANRKMYDSLKVQLICDADMLIFNCACNFPGSVHDSLILRQSEFFRAFEENPPTDGWLLGDSSYMLLPWLLTPYLNPPQSILHSNDSGV